MKAKNRAKLKLIKDLLWDKDLDVSKLARLIGRSRPWTSQVLYGHQKSQKTREAIASILGIKEEEI